MQDTNLDKLLDEVVKLLILNLKHGNDFSQSKLMLEMGSLGFQPKRIAELLGTTPNTVSVSISQSKKMKGKKKK